MSEKYIQNQLRRPEKLTPHPENDRIYGTDDKADADLLASIQQHGVLQPIDVLPDGTVVGGHRRLRAAIKAGVKYVPCNIRGDVNASDPLAVREMLLTLNRTREKSTEQKAREFSALNEIEKMRAAERQRAGAPVDPGEEKGRAASLAAKKVGLSHVTALNAEKVIKQIDALDESGKTDEARALRDQLNKSVAAATKSLTPETPQTKFDETIAAAKWILEVVVPRIQEHGVVAERCLGVETFQAGRMQNIAKTLYVSWTAAKRVAEHAKQQSLSQ